MGIGIILGVLIGLLFGIRWSKKFQITLIGLAIDGNKSNLSKKRNGKNCYLHLYMLDGYSLRIDVNEVGVLKHVEFKGP